MIANSHNVPVKTWRKWGELSRVQFDSIYRTLKDSKGVMLPPACVVSDRAWKVIAWNTAWIAADNLKEYE